jgi:hypothetical protein
MHSSRSPGLPRIANPQLVFQRRCNLADRFQRNARGLRFATDCPDRASPQITAVSGTMYGMTAETETQTDRHTAAMREHRGIHPRVLDLLASGTVPRG